MKFHHAKGIVRDLLQQAGVTINGNNPWDIQVFNEAFYTRAIVGGSLQVGETYVQKWWDCIQLDDFFTKVLSKCVDQQLPKTVKEMVAIGIQQLLDSHSISRSIRDVSSHYNLGNELFSKMLDHRLIYSCAYWKDATTLDEAQERKLDLVCRKLYLKPGMRVLDVGCGWGGFAKYAAEKYGAEVTGITLSDEQFKFAKNECKDLPVAVELMDYRNLSGVYDRIVSLGMFEHVGRQNYHTYMQKLHQLLSDDGLFLLHTIGANFSSKWTDPWLNRYIFPGSLLPSVRQIGDSVEKIFVVEDWHNFGADYDKTLMAWHHNFISNWPELKNLYDERFYRIWTYYLLSCAGSFRARKNQLWQIVLSKHGIPGGYQSVR